MAYITSFERMGIKKGRQEGLREGLYKGIAAVLSTKFGTSGKRLMARVQKIGDVNALNTLLGEILSLETLGQVRDCLANR